ncbi:MAG: imidazolonepropionase [Bacillota bacterium]
MASGKERIDLVLKDAAEVLTMAPAKQAPGGTDADERLVGLVRGASVLVADGRVVAVGDYESLAGQYDLGKAEVISAEGQVVTPGLVDAHTHLVFAGSREDEFVRRIGGATYTDIAASGGGINRTVAETRQASEDDLYVDAALNLERMMLAGATTVEVKSGYGLTVEDEMKLLRVIGRLRREAPVDIVPTFLGAHEVPSEYEGNPQEYVDLVADVMVPEVAGSGLAEFCDVFCEKGVFSVEDSRRILGRAKQHGLAAKLHADELAPSGGAELAAEVGAVSADHLLKVSAAGMDALAKSGTVAVLLPGTPFSLMQEDQAPARELRRRGVTLALGTDFNPGTSPMPSMEAVIGLACRLLHLTPAEALRAATIGAAKAVRRDDETGSIEPGKRADFVIWDAPTFDYIPYFFGGRLVRHVIAGGRVVVWNGKLEPAVSLLAEEPAAGKAAPAKGGWRQTLIFFLLAAIIGALTRVACQGPK